MEIYYRISTQNLGDDNTDEQNMEYVKAVQSAIQTEFSAADVAVSLSSDFQRVRATGFDDNDSVCDRCEEIANDVWSWAEY